MYLLKIEIHLIWCPKVMNKLWLV